MTSSARRRSPRLAFVLAGALACATLTSCEGFLSSSKMAQGQHYQSGDSRYDPYFDAVHREQAAAASWPDEKKSARKPLVVALSLTPDASDETVVRRTRERAEKHGGRDASLAGPYEETRRLEIERGRKLLAATEKLDALAKQGEDLKARADKEFENRGAEKADEKKTKKQREVRRELGGAADVCDSLAKKAKKGVREAEDFLDELARAYDASEAAKHGDRKSPFASPPPPPPPKPEEKPEKPEEPKKHEKKEEPKKHEKRPPPVAAAKPKPPVEKPPEKPAEKPEKPPEKPKPAPDEVFNP